MVNMVEELSKCDRNHKGAIGALSIAFFSKYGEEALPVISDVLNSHVPYTSPQIRELHGKGMKGFAGLLSAFDVAVKASTDEVVHFVTGGVCQFGFYDTDRRLCEAMMIFDKKLVETIVGQGVDMEILRTVSSGDKCCEVKFSIK
jgi:hypothetical protein